MKKLFIVEGYNDQLFCRHFLQESGSYPEDKIDIFVNSAKADDLRPNQTRAITRFSQRSSPYRVLIKSEIGRGNLISLLEKQIVNVLVNLYEIAPVVIFDHDRRNPQRDFDGIFESVRRRSNHIDFELRNNRSFLSGDILLRNYDLVKNIGNDSKVLSNFDFLTFRTSLEIVAGIGELFDDTAKEEKIHELVTSLKRTAVARLFE